MRFLFAFACFFASIIFVQSFPIIYAPTLGKLAIPAAIAGGYIATGVVGGLAGALAVKIHEPGHHGGHHFAIHDGYDRVAFDQGEGY
uniref:Ammonium transporter AmtB-like domain-containing protein n=1 Tax=Tetranychus urticae TaxID=32264 RepID=T1JU49_TETUR